MLVKSRWYRCRGLPRFGRRDVVDEHAGDKGLGRVLAACLVQCRQVHRLTALN